MTVALQSPVIGQPAVRELAGRLVELLRSRRLRLDTEAALQADIEAALNGAGIPHIREAKVTGGRIDFLCGQSSRLGPHVQSVGIEVKISGGRRAIHRQCAGYCQDPRIGHLIVVTGMALALPDVMNGRPVMIINMGRAFL